MPIPWIHIGCIPVPIPVVVVMWIATVATVALYTVSEMHASALSENAGEVIDDRAWTGPACLEYVNPNDYWSYRWCHEDSVAQLRYDRSFQSIESSNSVDVYLPGQVSKDENRIEQWFVSADAQCVPEGSPEGVSKQRSAVVSLYCCEGHPITPEHLIANVEEPQACHYRVDVCALDLCSVLNPTDIEIDTLNRGSAPGTKKGKTQKKLSWKPGSSTKGETSNPANGKHEQRSAKKISLSVFSERPLVDARMQAELKEKAREMFIHGYDAYMENGFPNSELASVSCQGQLFDPIKLPLVTLIDALDTLVVMHNYSEFCRAVKTVEDYFEDTLFEFDVNVSVFETTIRILGGLLSGHMLAVDEHLGIYSGSDPATSEMCRSYDGGLLRLAVDLGDRLHPAFFTATGIPYGTVNLKTGVPPGETTISSTAGAGSLLLEFEVLSRLSGIEKYGAAAKVATDAIVSRRSDVGLYGKHINIKTGKWAETASGIGSNSDSFYEYIIKSHFLFDMPDYVTVFAENYLAVKRFNQLGDWFADVDMHSGQVRRQLAENLQAFWPGIESSLGLTRTSARFLNALYSVLTGVGFMPEEFDYLRWQLPASSAGSSSYLLRPELIESTYFHYRSTHDRSWLTPAKWFLESLDTNTKTPCGYATVDSVDDMGLSDSMPSYFLAETCKYLYLLFDEQNFIHKRPFIFSTEAHMFDAVELNKARVALSPAVHDDDEDRTDSTFLDKIDEKLFPKSSFSDMLIRSLSKCPKKMWWEKEGGFNADFEDFVGAPLGKSFDTKRLREVPSHLRHNPHEELFCPPRLFNYLTTGDYMASFDHMTADPNRGGSCAVGDDLFHRLTGGKSASEEAEFADDKSADQPTGSTTVGPDYYAYEELRADGDTIAQTVSFEGTPDGEFLVDIYSNGFSVYSVDHGNLLHIFNLDQTTIFATEKDDVEISGEDENNEDIEISTGKISSESASNSIGQNLKIIPRNDKSIIIGEASGHVHRCSVQLVLSRPLSRSDLSNADIGILEVEVDDGYRGFIKDPFFLNDLSPLTGKIASTEVCSPAVFGRTSIEHADDPVAIVAPLAIAEDKIGCSPPVVSENEDGTESLPYDGMILLVERGKCTFEEKALHAQNGGAVGIVIVNSENSIFTMGGAAQSMISIELEPGDEANQKNLFELFKRAVQHQAGDAFRELPISAEQVLVDGIQGDDIEIALAETMPVTEHGDGSGVAPSPNSKLASTILNSVGNLKSSLSSAASTAMSALSQGHIGAGRSDSVVIPAVMVPRRYGQELLISYNHLMTKGLEPKFSIDTSSLPNYMDGVMNEGLHVDGDEEKGRFPKMRIEKDIRNPLEVSGIRLLTKKSWGANVKKNKQGAWELRITGSADRAQGMLGAGEGLTESGKSPITFPAPGVVNLNPVNVYGLLINKACDANVYPVGSKVYIRGTTKYAEEADHVPEFV